MLSFYLCLASFRYLAIRCVGSFAHSVKRVTDLRRFKTQRSIIPSQESVDTEQLLSQIGAAKSDEERKVLQTELEIVKLLQRVSAGLKTDSDQNA